MLKAVDIANFFVDIANSMDEETITNMKVNKLVYFAQAWSLVELKQPLFKEQILAWPHGPVVQSVYDAFKPCGSNNIESVCCDYNQDIFTVEQLELLTDVALAYGKYTAGTLRKISHKKGSPWERAYEEHKRNVISEDSIREYFAKLPKLPKCALKENCIGYRDADGYLVLPKEWDDDCE